VKANLVLIQSIWRRERNNLNAAGGAAVEDGAEGRASVGPGWFARSEQKGEKEVTG
jgi:hypothetical protein